LNERILNEIRKYANQPSLSHVVTDGLIHFIGGTAWTITLSDIARKLLVILASSAECEQHFSAFNTRHIITSQRNMLFPENVEAALSIVLEGYKNK